MINRFSPESVLVLGATIMFTLGALGFTIDGASLVRLGLAVFAASFLVKKAP